MKRIHSIDVSLVEDPDPDTSYLEQDEFEDRLAAYQDGEFSFVGVQARVSVEVNGTLYELCSPGLWGIESDSGNEYFAEVGADELDVLASDLAELGFSRDEFVAAAHGIASALTN